ncbi:MAG: hypothetical protein KF905_10595 [Flavobacteriales bacterium]|nr:hypothetical protein [Flavobacteriales bacterium]
MRFLLALVIVLTCGAATAQDPSDSTWARYHGGFALRDGVYADFNAFRQNRPTVPLAQLRDDQGIPITDIRRSVSKLYWQPDSGARQSIRKDRLWGFCQNGAVYVAAGNGFYRIGLMGSLCHMMYEMNYRDWDPYMYPYGGVTRTILMHQFLDIRTGQYLPFNASGMDAALTHDPLLQEEFRALPKKQRNSDEALFRFLRMYNERVPLYFPR